jgi:hypothetical protein
MRALTAVSWMAWTTQPSRKASNQKQEDRENWLRQIDSSSLSGDAAVATASENTF